MRVKNFNGVEFDYNLLEMMITHQFDIAVFHVAGPLDERNVLEAHQAGKKIIVLKRFAADNNLHMIYENLRKAGIPSCLKMGNAFEMTKKITDLLAKQFSVASGPEPEAFTSPSQI